MGGDEMKQYKGSIPEITLKFKTGETKKVRISSSRDAFTFLKELYDQDTIELNETCIALFLNRANNTIGWFKVSQGGISATVVDNKLIVATALKCAASAIILSHNHPSGNAQPGEIDKASTNMLKEACSLFDITLLDHIICTSTEYFSFADEGLI
jgi:DNA repair protein RadC